MSLITTLTVGVTATSGPFPPTYPAAASGFTAAASNPAGVSAGALSNALYYNVAIVALANDAAGASASELIFGLQGQFNQTTIGAITTPDGCVYQPSAATWTVSLVNGVYITTWIWPLATGASALTNGAVMIADAALATVSLTAAAVSSTEIDLSWVNHGPTPTEYILCRSTGTANPTIYQSLANTVTSYNDVGLAANTQYNYCVVATYADGTYGASGSPILGLTDSYTTTLTTGSNGAGGIGAEAIAAGVAVNPPAAANVGSITLFGPSAGVLAPTAFGALYSVGSGPYTTVLALKGVLPETYFTQLTLGAINLLAANASFSTSTVQGWSIWRWAATAQIVPNGQVQIIGTPLVTFTPLSISTPVSGISDTFNCACESKPLPADGFTVDTLANLRYRVMARCGYAGQASNPPPGMVVFLNEMIRSAQTQLYRQHSEFRTKRFYAWQMEPNVRYYGLSQDESNCRKLDPLSIDWVGFEDLNQAWYELTSGIDPMMYTRAQISTGWPTHYEIRSCIEIFPAPKAAYTLWIKGRFGLDPFVADTDCTTVDSEAVYLLACGLVKSHYGQIDAQSMLTQAANYTKYLVAGQHNTRRYVPRTTMDRPMTPPKFLPLGS